MNNDTTTLYAVTFYTDYKMSKNRYAVCNRNGEPLWYGIALDGNGEQSDGELHAAKKAVWLARKVREAIGQDRIRLNLIIDAQWLIWQTSPKQKGYVLTEMAQKYGIELKVTWIRGTENPADKWTVSGGWKSWEENDLRRLAHSNVP